VCAYRYHVTDAVNFEKSIAVDMEHGPVSDHPSDYAGVAYWYQLPAAVLPALPSLADRMPVTYVSEGPSLRATVKIVSGPKVGDADLLSRPWQQVDPEFVGAKPQRYWQASSPGETITLGVESPAEETFNLTVFLSASTDGARVEVGLDGKTLGAINTFAGQFVPWVPTTWPDVRLTRGPHLLTLKTLERDPRSSGSTVGWVGANFVPTSPFLGNWYVIGPFDNANHSGFDKAFPPEQAIDLAATYDGLGDQKVGWQPVDVKEIVNLASVCGGGDWRVAYGLTYVWAPQRMETAALFGKDDGAKIWVNGSVVFNENSWSHCFVDTYTAPLVLEKGWNTLLIKVANHAGSWAFGARLCDPDRRLKVSRDKK